MASAPLKLHQRCRVRNLGLGEVLFVGQTAFAPGLWIGVRLDERLGKNDGCVQGKRYFEADANFGVFVRSSQIDLDFEQGSEQKALRSTPISKRVGSPQVPRTESHIGKLSTPIYRANAGGSSSVGRVRGDEINARRAVYAKADSSPSVQTGRALANVQRVRDVKSGLLTQKQAIESRIETQAASRTPFDTPSKRSPLRKNSSTSSSLSNLSKVSNSNPSIPPKSARAVASEVESPPAISSSADIQSSVVVSQDNRGVSTEDSTDRTASTSINELVNKLTQQLHEARQLHSNASQKADQESKAATELRHALEVQHEDRQQLQKANTELQSLRETLESLRDSHESRLEELNEALEMAALDREMAEAKAENLEQELQVAKETVEELRTEIEVRREYASHDNSSEPHSSALEQAQLEQQNARLKEALVRMRDAAHESESALKKELSELRAEASIAHDLRDQYNTLQAKYHQTEQVVKELQSQAELAQSTEDIIEQLSERNSALETRLDELLAEVRDLDLLRTVNDELEETHLEAESQLQRELSEKDELITKLRMQLTSQQSQVADYDTTIERFRTLVRDQAQELQQLRTRSISDSIETKPAPEGRQSVPSSEPYSNAASNMSLKPSSKSLRDTQIVMLRQLEATQAQRHLDLVKHYLPADFWTVDEPAIAVLLILDRIAGLSKIFQHALNSSQDIEERFLSHSLDESLLQTCFLRHALAHLTALAEQGSAALFTAPAELFVAQGKHLTMLTASEQSLRQLIDLQVGGAFNESDCLEVCRKLVPQLEQVSSGLQACESSLDLLAKETGSALLAAYDLDTVLTGAGLAQVQLERIAENNIDTTDAQKHLQTLGSVARQARVPAHNMIRLLASLHETNETVNIESVPELPALGQLSSILASNVAKLASKLCEMAQSVFVEASAVSSSISLSEISESIQAMVQDAENLAHSLESLHMAIADPSNAIPIDDPSPMTARALIIYKATQHDQDVHAELASLAGQNDELRRSLQQKTEALDAAGVKIDRLSFQLDKSRSAAADAHELRNEVETLRQTLNQSSQQQLTSTPMHATASLKSDELSRAIRTLRIENQYLRARDYFVTLASLPPLHSASKQPPKQHNEWSSLAEKARSLTTSPEVVQLGKSSTRAIVQYQAQCRAICQVSDRVAQLI
ncbi:hypothetical protein MPSI1_001468 [Malassezia psittaci]|uniref:CAP-Gly domain-containing protein n=1 Tax=Malassezia psittaci TaxID=1821823 RepID=A0AAF0FDH9_9BASI|nr:hypothetical protein MPSI1_001468 [Malassezia psittaci]